MEIGFFDTTKSGEITSRLAADTSTLSDQISLNLNVLFRRCASRSPHVTHLSVADSMAISMSHSTQHSVAHSVAHNMSTQRDTQRGTA